MDMAKVAKVLGSEKISELSALSVEELKTQIAQAEKNISDAETELSENESIKALKDELKETVGPFKDAIKYQRMIQRFCSSRIEK
jgi:uncharacterized small protein (DUF1192 family)